MQGVTCYLEKPDGVHLAVRVVPRAGANRVERVDGDALRVRLAAAPVDGEANTALIAYLASWLGVPKSSITLVRGERGRQKVLRIAGAAVATRVAERIATLG